MKLHHLLPLVALVQAATGTSIFINNHNFETGGLADGLFNNNPGAVPTGWQLVTNGLGTGSFHGYFNPNDTAYLGTGGSPGTIGTMDGPNLFYFGSMIGGQGITQTLSSPFQANMDYDLTVAIGVRGGFQFMNGITMNLYAGTELIAARTISAASYASAQTAHTVRDFTLSYFWDDADAAFVGQALRIEFLETGTGSEVDIDNVRLTSIPEPGVAVLGAGAAAAGLLRRRRGA